MIGNKIADKSKTVSKSLPQNNSETILKKHDEKHLKNIYISPQEGETIIDVTLI